MTIKKPATILTDNERNKSQETLLRSYFSPRLLRFGSIQSLTAGGSGKAAEGNKGGAKPRP